MNQSTNLIAVENPVQVAIFVHIKDHYGEVILLAEGGSSQVHHLQPPLINLIESDGAEFRSGGILLRVGCVDSVDPCSLEHGIGFDLNPAES